MAFEPSPSSSFITLSRASSSLLLGQRRDVVSYVVVTDSRIDKDVLETIYFKLLTMKESIDYDKPLMGNEIMLVEDVMRRETIVSSPILEGGKEFSEYEAIMEYLRGGREALESYVKKSDEENNGAEGSSRICNFLQGGEEKHLREHSEENPRRPLRRTRHKSALELSEERAGDLWHRGRGLG